MTDEDFFAQNAQPKGLSDAEFFGAPTTTPPIVQPSQTEPSQSRESARPTISLPSLTESLFRPTAGQVVRNAQEGAIATAKAFIPTTPLQVAAFATPVISGVENLISTPQKLSDVLFGGKSVAEAFPETQGLVEAEKTPPFSKERFQAGFGTLGQLGMAAVGGRGLTETLFPRSAEAPVAPEIPLTEKAAVQQQGGEINAKSISENEAGYGQGVRQEEGAGGGGQNLEQAAQGNRPDSGAGPEVAPTVPQPEQFPSILQSAEEARRGTQPVSTEGQPPQALEQPKPEVAPATAGAAPPEPPIIGKDVAKNIPDFPADEKQIGLTKDYLSEDRKARGEAPLSEQARQTNPETWDNAERIMASNPNAGHELVASIIDNPRTLNPDEVGVLLRHRVNLSNQADIEFNRMTSESSTPMDKGDAVVKMQALNDARNQADQANNIVGTQLGRSFQFLQQLSSQDFSLSGINQQRLAAMGGKELTAPEVEQFTKENAQWSKDLLESDQALQNYQREQSKQSSALKAYKTRLQSATTEYERRLAFSDYAPAIRRELEGDPQLEKLKAARDQVRSQFQDQLVKDQLANRPMWQKILGGIAWAARESALSGYHTLAKLAGFTGGKLAEIPLTQTAERVWGLIPGFKDIAAQSEFGPGANAKALGKFYSDFFTTGMKQAAQQLRSGTSDFKAQYGDEKIPVNYPSFFGNLHGAEKTPLRVGIAGMTRDRIINNTMNDLASKAVSQGQDITDPIVQAAINKKAFDAGTDEILMGNNLFADSVNGLLRKMEANQPKTGEPSATLSVMSTLAKSLITKGIVRTPANFVKQVFERTPAGLGLGVARGIRAISKGVENVSPGERTAIMRLLGVGSVGSGMFLWGVGDALRPPDKRIFGGYYQPGEKRDPNDVKWGSVRIDGVTAPHYLTHNLLSEPAQMGATMMRVALSGLSKKDRTNKGLVSGLVASTLGLAEQAPIANPAVRLQKLTDPRQQSNYFGDIVRGLIPQFVQNIAEDTDKSEAGRKPSGVTETVKLAIPGLRQQVPERQVQKPAKSSKFGGAVTQP